MDCSLRSFLGSNALIRCFRLWVMICLLWSLYHPAAHGGITEFNNSSGITITDSSTATPYPSTITVSGITDSVIGVRVKINGFTHAFPDDVDAFLVSPGGQVCALFSDAGGSADAVNLNLVFDDAALTVIPDSSALTSATYRPANYTATESLPPGGTGVIGTYLTALAANGANGDWKLFIKDDGSGDAGTITSWSVVIETGIANPEISPEQPSGSPLSINQIVQFNDQVVSTTSASKTFTLKNLGVTPLLISSVTTTGGNNGEFSVNTSAMASGIPANGQTTFSVSFTPSVVGPKSTTLRITSNDADESVFDVSLQGNGVIASPEIVVEAPSGSPSSGPSPVQFSDQRINTASPGMPITIRNTGTAPLLLSSVTLVGGNASEFSLSTIGMLTSIPAGGNTIISMTFTPQSLGLRSTTLRVLSNDTDESVLDIPFAGQGTPNGIVIINPIDSNPLVNGVGGPVFGAVPLGARLPLTFTINNTSLSRLAIGRMWIDGADANDFVISEYPPIAISSAGTFKIDFAPTAVGVRTAVLHVVSSDALNTPFTTTLTGTGQAAAVGSLQVSIQPAIAANAGARWQVDNGPWRTSGAIASNLSVGNHNVTFTKASGYVAPVSRQVTITAGQTAVVVGNYNFPQLNLSQTSPIQSGDSVSYGSVATSQELSKTFTVTNSGTANLTALSVIITGANESDFDVATAPATSVSVGAATTFVVRFRPGSSGLRSAVMHVQSNAPGTSPFDVNFVGSGIPGTATASVQVHLGPTTAVADGARWRIDGGAWRKTGASVIVSAGTHRIGFEVGARFATPSEQVIQMPPGGARIVNVTFQPTGGPLDNWAGRASNPVGSGAINIAFGNGKFVAVDGGLASSTDGVNWTRARIETPAIVNSVLFAHGLFIAVGDGGLIYTSPNGEDWTKRDAGTVVGNLHGSIYANGKFVSIGSSAWILTSIDGTSWIPVTGTTNLYNYLHGVSFDGGQYVAVGWGSILTSLDAVNWTARAAAYGTEGPFLDIEYGVGMQLITGSLGYLTSTDGLLWVATPTRPVFTADPSAATGNHTQAFGNGVYVSVGGQDGLKTSTDGVNWTSHRATDPSLYYGFAFGGGTYVAVGDGGIIKSSTDAVTWFNRASGLPPNATLYAAAHGNGRFVTVGSSGNILTSENGISWTSRASTTNSHLRAVVYAAGQFVVGGDNALLTSPDGLVWTNRTQSTFYYHFGLAYGNGIYMTATLGGPPSSSPDGITWTTRSSPPNGSPKAIAFGNGLFVTVGTGGNIATSPDGTVWTARTSPTTSYLTNITFANNAFVAVCQGGGVVTSGDGITWTFHSVPADLWGIGYGDGLFVTGYGASIITDFVGGASMPDLAVEHPLNYSLVDQVGTVDFGHSMVGVSTARVCTIRNNGGAALNSIIISKDGAHSSDFIVGLPSATSLAPGETTSFIVSFTPGAAGTRAAALHIASNMLGDKNPFDLNLTGVGGSTPSELEKWRLQWFGTSSDVGSAANTNSPQQDGIPNLIKFACSMNPSTSGRMPGQITRNGGVLEFNYPRAKVALTQGLGFQVEWKDDLSASGWVSNLVTETIVSQDAITQPGFRS